MDKYNTDSNASSDRIVRVSRMHRSIAANGLIDILARKVLRRFFTCTFLFFTTLSAQSIWLNHDKGNSLAVEILKLSSEGRGSFVASN